MQQIKAKSGSRDLNKPFKMLTGGGTSAQPNFSAASSARDGFAVAPLLECLPACSDAAVQVRLQAEVLTPQLCRKQGA